MPEQRSCEVVRRVKDLPHQLCRRPLEFCRPERSKGSQPIIPTATPNQLSRHASIGESSSVSDNATTQELSQKRFVRNSRGIAENCRGPLRRQVLSQARRTGDSSARLDLREARGAPCREGTPNEAYWGFV